MDACTWCSSDRSVAQRLAPRISKKRPATSSLSAGVSIPEASPISASSSSGSGGGARAPKLPRDSAPSRALRHLHQRHGDVTNRLSDLSVRPSALVSADTRKSLGVGLVRLVDTPASPSGVVVAEYIGEIISVAEADARRARGEGGYSHHYCVGFVLWCRAACQEGVCVASRINGAYNAVDPTTGLRVVANCDLINRTVDGITRIYVRTIPNVAVYALEEFVTTYGSVYRYEDYAVPPVPVDGAVALVPSRSPSPTGSDPEVPSSPDSDRPFEQRSAAPSPAAASSPSSPGSAATSAAADAFVAALAASLDPLPTVASAPTARPPATLSALDLLDYSSDSS